MIVIRSALVHDMVRCSLQLKPRDRQAMQSNRLHAPFTVMMAKHFNALDATFLSFCARTRREHSAPSLEY